jgi:predicted nuclease of predicted toxin-antitoxin system
VKFIIDAQLPPALAPALRNIGCDAVAVRDIGLREVKDPVIWRYAVENQAAILTKDEDFADRCLRSDNPPVVIWLRVGNTSNRGAVKTLVTPAAK